MALLVVMMLSTPPAWAETELTSARDGCAAYMAAREELAPITVLSAERLQARLGELCGCGVELVGRVVGTAWRAGEQEDAPRMLMLELEDGTTVSVSADADVDELRIGEAVRVIAAVSSSLGVGDLTVKTWVREWDLPEDQRVRKWSLPDSVELEEAQSESYGKLAPAPTATRRRGTLKAPVRQPVRASREDVWTRWVLGHNSKLTDEQAESIVEWVLHYSSEFNVNHRLVFAVIKWESDFHPECVSHAGAIGLMQLMPGTARGLGVNPWNVQENIKGGVQYLAEQLAEYRGRPNYEQCILALAAYNAGPNAVKRAGGVPNIAETQRYVRKVAGTFYQLWQSAYP